MCVIHEEDMRRIRSGVDRENFMVQCGDPAPSADQDGVVRDDRAQICLSMIANVVAVGNLGGGRTKS